MAYTDLSICNMALTILGQDEIASIATGTSATKAQRLAYYWYEQTANLLMQDAPWHFLMKYAELVEDTTQGALTLYGWDYAFDLPTDFLKLWGLSPDDSKLSCDAFDVPHVIQGLFLLSNYSELYMLYAHKGILAKGTTPETYTVPEDHFSDEFATALSWKLASIWNVPLTSKVNHQQHFERQAMNALSRAISRNQAHDQGLELYRETFDEARTRVT